MTTPLIDALFGGRPSGRLAKPDDQKLEDHNDELAESELIDSDNEPRMEDDNSYEEPCTS